MDDLNNPLLFLCRHLVVARQAEAAAEHIRADVDAAAGNIGVAASAAVALGCNEGVRAVDRLHVHGL